VNVSCNKCGKKYVIADDKVAGKSSVKIRCKQCQNLITVAVAVGGVNSSPSGVVSAVQASPLQDWEAEDTRAMPAVDLTATWYAMIAGKQQGPFDARALQAKVADGQLTLRTYLWKPGMGDWKRASDVPEVSSIFAGVPVAASATAPAAQPAPEAQGDRAAPAEAAIGAASVAAPAAESAEPPKPAAGEPAPLADLFSDLKQSSPALATVKDGQGATAAAPGPLDPFAQLSAPSRPGDATAPPGEATKFFIARAGVNKRNPPWKIALFVVSGVGVPVLLAWLLSTFGVLTLPTVTRTTDDGQEVQENFFSPGGLSGVKDALTGDARRKREEAERARRQREAVMAKAASQKAGAGTTPAEAVAEEPPPPVQRPVNPDLAALYGDDTRTIKGPKVRKDDEASPSQVNTSGLSQDAAMKVVAQQSKAFQTCVETALHRNPNLAVGNVTIVLNVARSGVVTSAEVQPEKHRDADWAQCMVKAGKRIFFPSSDGETQLEVPFKVGVAITP
jgi:hypothetical protein